jgi:hypothetical protein
LPPNLSSYGGKILDAVNELRDEIEKESAISSQSVSQYYHLKHTSQNNIEEKKGKK